MKITKNISDQFTNGEYADYMIDKDEEMKYITEFQFTPPVKPITIVDAYIHMEHEYSGNVTIELSNGDVINYNCEEIRGNRGPDSNIKLLINNKVVEEEFDLARWGGNGGWIGTVMNYYITNYLNERYDY